MALMTKRMKAALLMGCAGMALATAMPAAAAAEGPARQYAIGSMDLDTALREFAMTSGHDVVFDPALVRGHQTSGVNGAMSDEAALGELLRGADLAFEQTASGGFVVRAPRFQASAETTGAGAEVEALIVTAQKREEDIQDVPIAISAFTQEDLTRSQVAGGPDLMTQVPNMTFTKTNFTSYSIQIRGIGTQAISATTDAAVAVAFNNTPFIRNRFFEQEFYDLERVEVLRGPQGTLYGRNATAGVVNMITAKPKFRYEAKVSADVANYNSTRLEGMVNLPLVEEKVALRLAGAWTKREGFDTNQLTGEQIDGRDLWSSRLSLRVDPTEWMTANLIWEHFEEDDDRLRSGKQLCKRDIVTHVGEFEVGYYDLFPSGGQIFLWNGPQGQFNQGCAPGSLYSPDSYQAPAGISLPFYQPLNVIFLPTALDDPYISTTQSSNLRVIESTLTPEYRAKSDVVELQVNVDVGENLSLTSETAYSTDRVFSYEDYNRFATAPGAFYDIPEYWGFGERGATVLKDGVFCDPQLGCQDRLVSADVSTGRSVQFSQEFRLGSQYAGPFNFSLGANFLRYDTEDKYYVFINSLSLYAAMSPYGGGVQGALTPYVPGVSDNAECLMTGFTAGDPTRSQPVAGCIYIDPNPIGGLNDQGHNYFLSKNPYKLISYAVFGEAYYDITDALKLTAGLRWTVDRKEAPRIPSWVLGADNVGYPVLEVVHQEWSEPTGRVTLDWKPHLSFTDETLLYASYAHGYKAGGANPPPTGVVCYSCDLDGGNQLAEQSATHPKTFEPEFVDAFEIGAKNTLLDGMLTFNGDIFYYDYKGYQISQIVDRSAVNYNFDAKVWGAELELDWRPLENLKFGLKGGYEDTRVADGMRAVDTMDRTAGHEDWMVVRPFPTFPSNCILPVELYTYTGGLTQVGNAGGGTAGPCELAYVQNLDPVTFLPYVPDPHLMGSAIPVSSIPPTEYDFGDYAGFNPETAPNHGEGFYKDLSGNQLPNAPKFTATLTADYTIPLPNDWLATLHTDLYYQSEAWTRIFNTPGYDKLKAYSNINLAAIFTNEDRGWTVMAYVKNVLDKDNITGAFLNSDDTGLTTNVFLNEPRLYGLRVTKAWTEGGWWSPGSHDPNTPYAWTVELTGQVQHHDAPSSALEPSFAGQFSDAINVVGAAQGRDLDWGDGREVRVTYHPGGSPWSVQAGLRYGRTNNGTTHLHLTEQAGEKVCALPFSGYFEQFAHSLCDPTYVMNGKPAGYYYQAGALQGGTNWSDTTARGREEHTMADFAVGRDVGLGRLVSHASISAGVRYAEFTSDSAVTMAGVPDYYLPLGWAFEPSTRTRYDSRLAAEREFSGWGPVLSVDGAAPIIGGNDTGRINLAWDVAAGVLFGKQETAFAGFETVDAAAGKYGGLIASPDAPTPISGQRSQSVTVPMVDLSLGLSYEIQRLKVGAGYRWERYFDVLDVGYTEHEDGDRTIDGPYFKVSLGFGG